MYTNKFYFYWTFSLVTALPDQVTNFTLNLQYHFNKQINHIVLCFLGLVQCTLLFTPFCSSPKHRQRLAKSIFVTNFISLNV